MLSDAVFRRKLFHHHLDGFVANLYDYYATPICCAIFIFETTQKIPLLLATLFTINMLIS
jgi:hypothetical protein